MTHEQQSPEPPDAGNSPEHGRALQPRIWIGSLADYNNGELHGDWIDANRPPETIHADIQRILASGPAAQRGEAPEEWGIFDYDEFGGLHIDEYDAIEDVSRLAQDVARFGEPFAIWAETLGPADATSESFADSYLGQFASPTAYAEELVADLEGERALDSVPDWLKPYTAIDYDALAHDIQLSGDITIIDDSEGRSHFYRTP